MSTIRARERIALVLAGGAARGAYEVGVVQYLLEEVARDLGRELPLDILSGTSVGAINACALAAFADEPGPVRAQRLVEHWTSLRIQDVIHPDLGELFLRSMRLILARPARAGSVALLDPAGLQRIVSGSIPFERIGANLRAGRFEALTVSTTHVASGRTVVFIERNGPPLPAWSSDPTVVPKETQIHAEHALASAAIPFLFPPVRIGDELHCDGGLRQNVPLSPARRLGADAILVVSPRHVTTSPIPGEEEFAAGPLAILGQTLNALMLDRIDSDLDRLRRINLILDAGSRAYGDEFVDKLNRELGFGDALRIRPLRSLLIRASVDLGELANKYVRSLAFAQRASGVVGRLIRRLSSAEGTHSDLLSYVLFDGEFARLLIALGRADAATRHDDLVRFFSGALGD